MNKSTKNTSKLFKKQFNPKMTIIKQSLLISLFGFGLSLGLSEDVQAEIVINITNTNDNIGLELGDKARARGIGSIATGTNSIAIGTNAVATGNNETQETIKAKLAENKAKLDEIEAQKLSIKNLANEINDIQIRQRDVIEAGIRVEQIRQSKEKARVDWQTKLGEYNTFKDSSQAFLQENQAKIDDLNSRLTGLSKMQNVNISSDAGLTSAATELKSIVEKDTTLNLTVDFYKDYVKNYYTVLGDLRKNELSFSKIGSDVSYNISYFKNLNPDLVAYGYYGISNLNPSLQSKDPTNTDYYQKLNLGYTTSDALNGTNNSVLTFAYQIGRAVYDVTSPTQLKKYNILNINTDIIDINLYNSWKNDKEQLKNNYINYTHNIGNGLVNFSNDSNAQQYLTWIYNYKFEMIDLGYDIAYFQGKYEETKDNSWLDKKKIAYDRYIYLNDNMENANKTKGQELLNNNQSLYAYIAFKSQEWRTENITNIQDKNKITTEKLTADLEQALGINKNAVIERQNEIQRLLNVANQAQINYNNINPTEKDLILAREYEAIVKQLKEKGDLLKTATDRLQWLNDNLTLNDLKLGENAIAIGTDSLASGKNSISFGTKNITTNENAVAIGYNNLVTGQNSVALGQSNNVLGNDSYVIGSENTIKNAEGSTINPSKNYILGSKNTINSSNNIILGSDITSQVDNAIVIGNASTAVANAVSVGSASNLRKITNVAEGEISLTSNDVVTGKQLKGVVDSLSNIELTNYYTKPETDALLVTKVDKTTYNTEQLAVNNKITNNTTEINNLKSIKADKSEVYTKLETDSKLNTKVDNALYTTDKQTINANIATNKSNIEFNKNAINNLDNIKANKADVYTKAETYNKSEIDTQLAKKVDNTTYISEQQVVNNKINENTSNITLNKNNIASNTTNIALNKSAIDNLDSIKANKDATNINDTDKSAWREKLGINDLATIENVNNINDMKLNKDFSNFVVSNMNPIGRANLIISLNAGANINNPIGSLVTDTNVKNYVDSKNLATQEELDKKANTTLNNITNEGKLVIQGLTDVKAGDGIEVSTSVENGVKTSVVQLDKSEKAKKDMTSFLNKDANLEKPTGSLVTDTNVKEYVDKTNTQTQAQLDNKANIDLSNINDAGKKVIQNLTDVKAGVGIEVNTKLENGVKTSVVQLDMSDEAKKNMTNFLNKDANIEKPTGNLVTDTNVKEYVHNQNLLTQVELDAKANKDLSNISDDGKLVIQGLTDVKAGSGIKVSTVLDNGVKTSTVKLDLTAGNNISIEEENNKTIINAHFDTSNLATKEELVKTVVDAVSGDIKAGESRAVNGDKLYQAFTETNQKINNNTHQIAEVQNKLLQHDNQISSLQTEVKNVGSMSSALSSLKPITFDKDRPSQFMAGVGNYRSTQSLAVGMSHYVNENLMVNAGLALSGKGGSDTMANVGVTYKFGFGKDKGVVNLTEEEKNKANILQLQQQVARLLSEVETLKSK